MSNSAIRGSCLCGSTRWRVNGTVGRMSHCHCSMCRKAHGAAFATYVSARSEDFEWLSGKEQVRDYESSTGFVRSFCDICGSVVPFQVNAERLAIAAGCLDDDPGIRAEAHIFASAAPAWSHVSSELPRHDGYEDPTSGPNVQRTDKGPATPGVLRGSCLCDDVAYEVTTPLKAVHNCHCSRCRKARAAAHTTNGFTSMGGVRFIRGEAQLTTYRLPEAKFFAHTFCSRCGSGMPRLDPSRDLAAIPLGSLDDEPDLAPQDHIFVGSKAPWFDPSDELPRFDGPPS